MAQLVLPAFGPKRRSLLLEQVAPAKLESAGTMKETIS
jgi:hypothetical protein